MNITHYEKFYVNICIIFYSAEQKNIDLIRKRITIIIIIIIYVFVDNIL